MKKFNSIKTLITLFVLSFCIFNFIPVLNVSAASKSIVLDEKSTDIYIGDTIKLSISGNKNKITWKSSNPDIAKVNKKGVVTGITMGDVKITGTSGNAKYVLNVSVKQQVMFDSKININETVLDDNNITNTVAMTINNTSEHDVILTKNAFVFNKDNVEQSSIVKLYESPNNTEISENITIKSGEEKTVYYKSILNNYFLVNEETYIDYNLTFNSVDYRGNAYINKAPIYFEGQLHIDI